MQAVGLSEVTVDEIKDAQRTVAISTVQNRYNVTDRKSEDVLDYCHEQGIGFIPWFPIAAGDLARSGGPLDTLAAARGLTVAQLSLAWLLRRSPVMMPIPGTSKVAHLEENLVAANVTLDDTTFDTINAMSS